MPARTPGNEISKRPSESMDLEQQQAGGVGNERLTALVSLVLPVLIIVELVTSALLRMWLPLIAVHSLAHLQQVPRSIASDWSTRQGSRFPVGRGLRLGTNLGALLLGVIAAVILFPAAIPLFAWGQTNAIGVGPFLVGMG